MQAAMAQMETSANEQTRRLVPTIRWAVGARSQGAVISNQSSVIRGQGHNKSRQSNQRHR